MTGGVRPRPTFCYILAKGNDLKLIRFAGDGADTEINSNVLHMHPAGGSDYTLCGITLDGDEKTAGSFRDDVESPKVTCPECVAIIRHCRRAKI